MLQNWWPKCYELVAAREHPGMQGIDNVVISVPVRRGVNYYNDTCNYCTESVACWLE